MRKHFLLVIIGLLSQNICNAHKKDEGYIQVHGMTKGCHGLGVNRSRSRTLGNEDAAEIINHNMVDRGFFVKRIQENAASSTKNTCRLSSHHFVDRIHGVDIFGSEAIVTYETCENQGEAVRSIWGQTFTSVNVEHGYKPTRTEEELRQAIPSIFGEGGEINGTVETKVYVTTNDDYLAYFIKVLHVTDTETQLYNAIIDAHSLSLLWICNLSETVDGQNDLEGQPRLRRRRQLDGAEFDNTHRDLQLPSNDDCAAAIPILSLDVEISGSTINGRRDGVGFCGTVHNSPGVWYSIVGTGDVFRADTCSFASFDTQISVFDGSCDGLVCVDGNDDFCEDRSAVTWRSNIGSVYYILVHGLRGETGNFALVVTKAVRPPNDDCIAASPILSLDVEINGTTANGLQDEVGYCGTSHVAAGVWYSIVATVDGLRADTCSFASFDTKISVFDGSCDSLVCVDGNSDYCGHQSAVMWSSDIGTVYYILVHGSGGETGNFTLVVTEVDRPPNDDCIAAIPILSMDIGINGTTTDAFEDGVVSCGTSHSAPGVWYSIVGTGGALMADTCSFASFDTKISVFDGTCESLICIDGNSDSCGDQSAVAWSSNIGAVYYILVHGSGGETGNFIIMVTEVVTPPNDDCTAAIPILSMDVEIIGTTINGFEDGVGFCGTPHNSPGVWYSIVATVDGLRADTCTFTTFDTRISVFEGSCSSLVCVDGNSDSCGDQSAVSWNSNIGGNYYILVHGSGGETGNFTLVVTEVVRPPNDECTAAIPILSIGVEINGTTTNSFEDGVGVCGTSHSAPGVWYSVMGTGDALRADTCSFASFDTKISVFDGSCDNLVCIGGSSDACGDQSAILWNSKTDTVYYILVHGSGSETGDFTLTVTEVVRPPNDDCTAAIPISSMDVEISGSTTNSFEDGVGFCGTLQTSPGVWYSLVGTGETFRADTCSFASFDTKISVLDGTCDSPVCVDGNSDSCGDQSAVTWISNIGTVYYILVHGSGRDTGNFTLVVTEVARPSNDDCAAAIPILSTEVEISGSTINAFEDGVGFCGTSHNSPGVWYSIMGTGDSLRADTCSLASFDTKISVFYGSCDSLVCVDGNSDFCGDQSVVTWSSSIGTVYYILVHGSGETGNFALVVTDLVIPPNDDCTAATPIVSLDVDINGTTTNALEDGVGLCGTNHNSPGVWYSIVGTGDVFVADTCLFASFDTKISVFDGSCDSLDCVDGNDDFCGEQSSITWSSSIGTIYYILVHGFGGETGNFSLAVRAL